MEKIENKRKNALVTGGGTGIGRAIAKRLGREGYNVAVHYNSSRRGADEVCSEIISEGGSAYSICADLSDVNNIARMFDDVEKRLGGLDIFVNNSGITEKASFLETDESMFDKMCSVNYKGAFFCIQNAAKIMVKHGIRGSIVVISSNNYKAHFADVSVYGSLKAALTKMSEHAALELAKYKIRVNVIAPGWTDTGASRLDNKESTFYKIPMKRWCTVDEIAEAVMFLSAPSAASITGTCLIMDGGAVLLSDKAEKYGL